MVYQDICTTRAQQNALEAALRKYGHPAAIADLDSLGKKSKSRRVFLEATFTMCKDNLVYFIQKETMEGTTQLNQNKVVDRKTCPLVLALREYGLNIHNLSDSVLSTTREWLGTFGRPIASKTTMLHDHSVRLQYHRQHQARLKSNEIREIVSTSKNIVKEQQHVSDKFKTNRLKPLMIRDLKLFDSNVGTFIEGKLLIEPFTPMVGCTTIMEDKNGDVLLIALYNFLPDGVSGSDADAIASAKLPKGSTVRISEPFLKVFKDGSRGVRIDNASDITVVLQDKVTNKDESLEKAKANGNSYFQKKMYLAAIDSYVDGLRKAEFVPTLLSNRSQAFINMHDWKNALADAAASLTIRPGCKKTWCRYQKALGQLESDIDGNLKGVSKTRKLFETVLLARSSIDIGINLDKENIDTSNATLLKNEGNSAFKSGDFNKAVQLYSIALEIFGKTCRLLLSNWSLCCLNIGGVNDSLAGSAASLRIAFDEKALYRLCKSLTMLAEPSLSLALIENDHHKKSSKLIELRDTANVLAIGESCAQLQLPLIAMNLPHEFLPYWHGNF